MESNRLPDDLERDPLPEKATALVAEIETLLKDRQLGKAQALYFKKIVGLSAVGRKTVDAAVKERLRLDEIPDEVLAILKGTRVMVNRESGFEIDEDVRPLD